jgi:UDP-N-acetylglucosamine 3-dehydrogenase
MDRLGLPSLLKVKGGDMDSIRIGIAGTGRFAKIQARVFGTVPHVQLLAFASRNAERAREVATSFGVPKWYGSYDAMMQDPEIDAVSVCTLEAMHRDPCIAAAQSGKHVLVEKPIATTLADADAIIQAAERYGVILMVEHPMRFFLNYAKLKERLSEDDFGRIVHIHSRKALPRDVMRRNLAQRQNVEYSLFLDAGVHEFDLVLWYAGQPVEEVVARTTYFSGSPVADGGWALLSFQGGALAGVESSWLLPDGHYGYRRMEVTGIENHACLQQELPWMWVHRGKQYAWADFYSFPEIYGEPAGGGLYLALKHFADCVRLGSQPVQDPREARAALEVCLAADYSARTGQPVRLPITDAALE